MKALFLTTRTVDCKNHVRAWESAFGSAAHLAFDHAGIRNDWQFPQAATDHRPDVIFYIGAHEAPGNPRPETLRGLREHAKTILLCSDAMDKPWHKTLEAYRKRGCFDLMVSIDGAKDAPVDLATLTPVDGNAFQRSGVRDIRCGFSGSVGRWNARSETVHALEWFGGLTVRRRETGDYDGHAGFMSRCRMILNLSFTGSQLRHHIKGRVLETGWAGSALLEYAESTIAEWFPKGCWIPFTDARDAARLIATLPDDEIDSAASALSREVRRRFSAKQIYGEILDHVGLTEPITAA